MNKINLFLLFSFFITISSQGQSFERILISETDSSKLYVNDGDSNELYYLQFVPKTKIKGAIVVFPSGGETTEDLIKQIKIPQLASKKGIITIIPSINWGTETRAIEIQLLNKIFKKAIDDHNIPKENFVLGGLSNGGMISLTYAQQAVKEKGSTYILPKGIFGLDVPLDKAHFYSYCQREIKRNFSQAGMNEAHWFMNNFNQIYGGSPQEYPERYVEASIYSYGAEDGGNAKFLKEMPIRMYTDLDVDWLTNQRRRDLYDWNGTDIVAMINDLKLMGNEDANVLITMGKGVRLDGRKHPHSWSIMDNQDCFDWILKLFEK
ncbi:MAG: hypothetical protein AB8F94_06025 [Saprospiraceae bacterium]